VPSVARELERRGSTVALTNLGVPGAVLAPSIEALGNQYGRGIPANFEEQEGPFVPRTATLVTIFAGGNDVNAVATAIDRGGAGPDVNAFIDRQIQDFGASYNRLVDVVRSRTPGARIIALNLPNFATLPLHDPIYGRAEAMDAPHFSRFQPGRQRPHREARSRRRSVVR